MSEEKDESQIAREQALVEAGHHRGGTEERWKALSRRFSRLQGCRFARPCSVVRSGQGDHAYAAPNAQAAIRESIDAEQDTQVLPAGGANIWTPA
ncbi:ABC transporter ATP-binding protein [Rhodococcus opacus RKJ300 = JCM 13270]|uniref:ABC transporter ATP-binding protein n=1 Tax=Rhodococcus opacus RKJ300 = JCM 13270 TaxID=1165867 RepID=I0WRM9_RHOOP|nr:ABC transporter ATP-binding protein [Rhodococcus opacus RKJ300 = JCM 13270]